MLYLFIIESFTDTMKAQVLLYEVDYTITPVLGLPMKLKWVIMLTYIDNRATTARISKTVIDMGYQLMEASLDVTNGLVNKSGSYRPKASKRKIRNKTRIRPIFIGKNLNPTKRNTLYKAIIGALTT